MPCPHCPHCQKLEAEEAALRELLAEQEIKEEPVDENVAPGEQEEVPDLNPSQLTIAQEIVNSWKSQRLHLIEGIAATGKTYLLAAIGSLLRNAGFNVLHASSSAHQSPTGTSVYYLLNNAPEHKLLEVDVILIDNVNQISENDLKALSDRLKRVMNPKGNVLFGGKGVVLAADFGLCLPYCQDWNQKAMSSPKHHISGDKFKKHRLPTPESPWSQMLDEIRKSSKVALPEKKIVSDLDALIEFTFGELYNEVPDENSVLLAPRKKDVEFLNREILNRINGREISLEARFDGDVIRSDLDLHEIRLKEDSIIILEEKFEDLAKGTRLVFQEHNRTHLSCRVLDGPRKGSQVDIERVERKMSANALESQQWVLQFPVSLGFAMTIHAAQGRRFERVGCFKLDESFEHGMVYTALSRSKDFRVLSSDPVIPNRVNLLLL